MQTIKNIIFDLGGVLLDVDYAKTKTAFEDLGVVDFGKHFKQHYASPLFERFEKGLITVSDFYHALRENLQLDITNQQIATAWNAMLGHFLPQKIEWLKEKARHYNVYLYSNTNQLHYDCFMNDFQQQFQHSFDTCFQKAYYSHLLHQRKPDAEGFLTIMQIENLQPKETLFIDDTSVNIVAAAKLGMQTHLLQTNVMDIGI